MVDVQSAIPVLSVADYPRARDFYVSFLGFEIAEEGGDPARFGIFKRGRAVIFLDSWQEMTPPQNCWSVYLHVDDIEAVRTEIASRGIPPGEVRSTVYGMLEFDITDPDGHILCFGQDDPAHDQETTV